MDERPGDAGTPALYGEAQEPADAGIREAGFPRGEFRLPL